jgi:hypothetical protein
MAEGGNYQNANPVVYEIAPVDRKEETYEYGDEEEREEMTAEEIFGSIFVRDLLTLCQNIFDQLMIQNTH